MSEKRERVALGGRKHEVVLGNRDSVEGWLDLRYADIADGVKSEDPSRTD